MAIAVEDPWWKYAYSTMFASIRGQRWAAASDEVHCLTGCSPTCYCPWKTNGRIAVLRGLTAVLCEARGEDAGDVAVSPITLFDRRGLSRAAPVAAAAYGYGSSAAQNGLIRAAVSAGQRASGMLSLRSILVKMRVALIPGRIVRTMTPNSASSTVMDERRSVLAEDRDVQDLLDRHHDGSGIHGQLALSANMPAAAQASIMHMRRILPVSICL
jgi:hypothetical protein